MLILYYNIIIIYLNLQRGGFPMRRNKLIRAILILTLSIIGIYFTLDRNIQHLLCGIVMPQLINFIINVSFREEDLIHLPYLTYLFQCVFWEGLQAIGRGYLQVDQLICDIIGIILSWLIFQKVFCE